MLANPNSTNKLFPQAYLTENTTTDKGKKNNHLFIWIIFGLIALIFGMFSIFQTDLINEAAKLSEVIR